MSKKIKFDATVSFEGQIDVDIEEDESEDEAVEAAIEDLGGEIENVVAGVYGVDPMSVNVDLSHEEDE